jgi:hypothetical protein
MPLGGAAYQAGSAKGKILCRPGFYFFLMGVREYGMRTNLKCRRRG